MNFVKVHIRKVSEATDDAVLVDWLGVYVEYAEIRATTCYISNGTKGEDFMFQVEFKNHGTVSAEFDFRVQLFGSDYDDGTTAEYEPWVNITYSGANLSPDSSVNSSITIPVLFEGTEDKQTTIWDGLFALNCGEFEIKSVYTFGEDWGSRTISQSDRTFSILANTSVHKVFCIILEDSDFADDYGNLVNWNGTDMTGDYGASDWNSQAWSSCDWFYNTNCSIDLVPLIVDPYDFTDNHVNLSRTEGYTRVQVLLGTPYDWDNVNGTSQDNHGFDMLWLLTGEDGAGNPSAGGNTLYIENWADGNHDNDDMFHIFQHELGHLFNATHLDGDGGLDPNHLIWEDEYKAIMGAGEFPYYTSHEFVDINYEMVLTWSDHYDGPS
jgi:hypothetical protein